MHRLYSAKKKKEQCHRLCLWKPWRQTIFCKSFLNLSLSASKWYKKGLIRRMMAWKDTVNDFFSFTCFKGYSHDGQIHVCQLVAMVIWSWTSNVANRGQNVPVGSTPTDTIGPRSRSRLSPRYVLVVLKWPKNRSIFNARRVFSFDFVQSDSFLCQPTDEQESWDVCVWIRPLTIGCDYRGRSRCRRKSARRVNGLLQFTDENCEGKLIFWEAF